jgi:hypothetical protein
MAFLLALPVAGADKIEGAFGLKLGDVFSPKGIESDAQTLRHPLLQRF